MKGVLVIPAIALCGWDSYHRAGRRHNSLPHGLVSIATQMRRAGHAVDIVDLRQYKGMNEAVKAVLDLKPEFVGCGAMTVDWQILVQLFRSIKSIAPHITTVAGGVHASVAPQDAIDESTIDYIVTGEGEWTLTSMADNYFVGYDRVTRGEIPDLELLLPIDRELVDYRNGELMHGTSWNTRAPYVTVMTARGCPYKCAFCWPVSPTLFGPKVRQRSIGHVMSELGDLARRYKPAFVDFIDDMFMMSPDWTDAFIEQYPKRVGAVPFNIATRVDWITRAGAYDTLRKLKALGLESVNVGFESGCQRHLDFLGKGTTVEQNRYAGWVLKELGLKIIANVMFGIPGETPTETMETIKLLKDIEADYPSPAYFTPYPGCALHETHGKDLITTDYAKLNRHANDPKIRGVDYGPIRAIIQAELRQ